MGGREGPRASFRLLQPHDPGAHAEREKAAHDARPRTRARSRGCASASSPRPSGSSRPSSRPTPASTSTTTCAASRSRRRAIAARCSTCASNWPRRPSTGHARSGSSPCSTGSQAGGPRSCRRCTTRSVTASARCGSHSPCSTSKPTPRLGPKSPQNPTVTTPHAGRSACSAARRSTPPHAARTWSGTRYTERPACSRIRPSFRAAPRRDPPRRFDTPAGIRRRPRAFRHPPGAVAAPAFRGRPRRAPGAAARRGLARRERERRVRHRHRGRPRPLPRSDGEHRRRTANGDAGEHTRQGRRRGESVRAGSCPRPDPTRPRPGRVVRGDPRPARHDEDGTGAHRARESGRVRLLPADVTARRVHPQPDPHDRFRRVEPPGQSRAALSRGCAHRCELPVRAAAAALRSISRHWATPTNYTLAATSIPRPSPTSTRSPPISRRGSTSFSNSPDSCYCRASGPETSTTSNHSSASGSRHEGCAHWLASSTT